MKDPTNSDKTHGAHQTGKIKLEPANSTIPDGRVDVSANPEADDLNCERSWWDKRNGVKPVCGRCAKLRREKCQRPSVSPWRTRSHMSDRLRRAQSSTTPAQQYADSATPKGPLPGHATG
ncbi:hypothetical protein CLCR_07767 [Cladophialophora carrionii]|uniref:Uncharacterized protein n=1 Tax=Cladophialophora carrionii TaxID=86049 RepID=A0A1C1CNH8_9EURO|nr:hypothetical protein CLCR_07767 [Cladophialophora carrionii]